jgi:hypothetical protein
MSVPEKIKLTKQFAAMRLKVLERLEAYFQKRKQPLPTPYAFQKQVFMTILTTLEKGDMDAYSRIIEQTNELFRTNNDREQNLGF